LIGDADGRACATPPLNVVRFTGEAFTRGIEIHDVEGQVVKRYCVAKTLADLFKYRTRSASMSPSWGSARVVVGFTVKVSHKSLWPEEGMISGVDPDNNRI